MHGLYLPHHEAFVRWHFAGTGRPVVWLPGMGFPATGNFLDTVCEPALSGTRAILIDPPGAGASDSPSNFSHRIEAHAQVVAAVLDHLGCGPCPVVGYSMGGSIAIALAAARPDLVERLLVAEGNLAPGGGAGSRYFASFTVEEFAATGLPGVLQKQQAEAVAGDAVAGFLAGAWGRIAAQDLHGMARGLVELPEGMTETFLGLPCPRTFVYGEAGYPAPGAPPAADTPDPERLRADGVRVEVLAGTGHEMMLADPAGFAAIVARWLADQPQSAASGG